MQRLDTINNTQRRGQILPPPISLGSPVTPHILRIPHNATPCSTMLCGLVQHAVSYGILQAFNNGCVSSGRHSLWFVSHGS